MNPKKLGGLANYRQEPWKAPLPQFIEDLYFRRFGKTRPDRIISIEQLAGELERKKAEKRHRKQAARDAAVHSGAQPLGGPPPADRPSLPCVP